MIHWVESRPIKGIYDISEESEEHGVGWIDTRNCRLQMKSTSSDIWCNVNIADVNMVNTDLMKSSSFFLK